VKLKSHLRRSPLETLQAIAEFWRLEPEAPEARENAEALADHLYPRLQSPAPFKQAFERLEGSERELVYFLALHGGELPVDEFRRRAGLHAEGDLDSTFERLNRRGFLWRERLVAGKRRLNVIGLPEPFVRLIDLPPFWRGFLGRRLQSLGLDELKAIAERVLGCKFEGRKKQVLVHLLREKLLDPACLRERLEASERAERELFDRILQRNGACVWRELLETGAQRKLDRERADLLQELVRSTGLVFAQRTDGSPQASLVSVPRDVRHVVLSGFRRDERTLVELSRSTESTQRGRRRDESMRPSVVLDNAHNLPRDLAITLSRLLHHSVKALNNGGIGRNDLKKIAPLLSHNKTPKYVAFLAMFAMAKKLILPVGGRWRVSRHVADWLADGPRVYREMYEYWLDTNEWNEEFPDGDIVHVDQYPQNLVGIVELRKLVLRVLEKTPVDAWIDFATFAESLLPQVAIEIPGRYDLVRGEGGNRHMLLVMESIVAESLYWFGLVTLGVSDLAIARELGGRTVGDLPSELGAASPSAMLGGDECMFCFKVSPTARQMFGGKYLDPAALFADKRAEGAPYAQACDRFTVQPNLEIVAPPDLNLKTFYRLLNFTEVRKVDIMTTLAVTRESLCLGLERGFSTREILDFLAERSRKDLPETIVQLVEECGGRHGEIEIGPAGGYLYASDPMHVEELRANPRVARYVKDVFEERVVLLNRTTDVKKLTRELQKMGFMPRVASDSLYVTGEGLFHVTLRPEELHQLLAVLHFAQAIQDDADGEIFDDRVQALLQRLAVESRGESNPDGYVEPLVKAFRQNYDKLLSKRRDEETRRLKKQVNRLLNRAPRRSRPVRFAGENPTATPAGVERLIKFAIEREMPVKIHYRRSTGQEIDEVIEPESLQGKRVYAFCPDNDQHHIYAVQRILQAAL
jgi:hypothetical protein